MKITDYQQFELEFDCKEVQELLFLYVRDRDDLSLDECWAIERHLDSCDDCLAEYDETKFVNDALIANRDYLIEQGVFAKPEPKVEKVSKEEANFRQFQAKMARVIAREKKAKAKARRVKLISYVKTVSAVAACLLVAFGICWAISSIHSDHSVVNQPIATKPHVPFVKIELVSGTTTELIPAGQLVVTTGKLKTLRINDNREMILNTGTQLSIVPYNFGCVVKLDKGEIYTKVEHDGKPFIVETAHGRAVITGTTFNIKADNKQMELVVAEGSVQFESEKGAVNVTVGHKSLLALNNKPTMPVSCDTRSLTAWTTGLNMPQDIAVRTYGPELDFNLSFDSKPVDLKRIDYETWINENRDWFKQQFPHVFQIKEALAKDGIEVDYPQLLILSGEIRRFVYPPTSTKRCIEPDALALKQVASFYGKDSQWLSDAIGSVNFAADTFSLDIVSINMEMFNQWLSCFKQARQSGKLTNSNLFLDSLHASVYLAKTRTLLWLIGASNNEDEEVLVPLEEQVTKANEMTAQLFELINCDENSCMSRSPEIISSIEDNISAIAGIEKEVQSK